MQKKVLTPTNILLALAYMLFIITFSVVVVLHFRPLYYSDIDRLGIQESSGLSTEKIRENYNSLIRYNSMFNYDELEFPDLPMSEKGKIHFEEVKDIFVVVQYTCILMFFMIVLGTSWKSYLKDCGYLKIASIVTIVIPLILGILIALNWETFFVTFHHIFFRNDYWIFDPAKDPIITLLPDAFFMHAAMAILGLVVFGSVVCYGAFFLLHRRWDKVESLPESK